MYKRQEQDFRQVADERGIRMSRQLKYLLITLCNGPPLTIIQTTETDNGFEIWRLLCRRYSPDPVVTQHGALAHILEPSLPEAHVQDAFGHWESDIARWERDTGTVLPDNVKLGILHNRASGALQQHLRLNAGHMATFAQVRAVLLDYFRSLTSYRAQQTQPFRPYSNHSSHLGPTPMDADAFRRTKGKGKKGLGNGKLWHWEERPQ